MLYPFRRSGIKRRIEGTDLEQELIYVKGGEPFWDTIYPSEEWDEELMEFLLM